MRVPTGTLQVGTDKENTHTRACVRTHLRCPRPGRRMRFRLERDASRLRASSNAVWGGLPQSPLHGEPPAWPMLAPGPWHRHPRPSHFPARPETTHRRTMKAGLNFVAVGSVDARDSDPAPSLRNVGQHPGHATAAPPRRGPRCCASQKAFQDECMQLIHKSLATKISIACCERLRCV